MPARIRLDQFRSAEEAFFFQMSRNLPQFVPELQAFEVERVVYEGKTFCVGEVKYTPDFNITLRRFDQPELRVLVNVEVKGSKVQKGYRETKAKLAIVASAYPEYAFIEVFVLARLKTFKSFEFIERRPLVYLTKITGV